MEKEDKHLNGSGLGRVWAKIKAQYLAKTGGTLTGNVIFNNGCTIQWKDNVTPTPNEVNILGYSSSNILVIGYGQQTKGDTNIYGQSINLKTNGTTTRLGIDASGNTTLSGNLTVSGGITRLGDTGQCDIYLKRDTISSGTPTNYIHYPTNAQLRFDRYVEGSSTAQAPVMTLGADGNVYCHNAIYEGGTLISTKYTYTAGSSIDITNNVVKVAMTATSDPTASGNTISFIDSISQDTAGKITVTKKGVQAASASASGVVTTEAQTFAGNKTFNGTTLFANNVNIKKSTSSTTPLTIATSYSSGDNSNRAAIEFEKNDGTAIGYIGCRIVNNVKEPYFNGGSYHTIWHAGNSNLLTVSWKCLDLTANGDISAVGNVVALGGVAAGGIADLTIY